MKKYQLPREFATKWVAALRSGEYKQGTGGLYNDGCYCCLGVAGVIACVNTDQMQGEGVFEKTFQNLPESFPKQLIGSDFPQGNNYNKLIGELTVLNDKQGKSFLEIADWIESNVAFI